MDRLLTPNARLLVALSDAPQSTERALSLQLNCSYRHIVRLLHDLEQAGFITVDRSTRMRGGCIYTVHLSDAEVAALRLLLAREDVARSRDAQQGV